MTHVYCLIIVFVLVSLAQAKYPQSSLQCYSTYTQPGMKLICPEAR